MEMLPLLHRVALPITVGLFLHKAMWCTIVEVEHMVVEEEKGEVEVDEHPHRQVRDQGVSTDEPLEDSFDFWGVADVYIFA